MRRIASVEGREDLESILDARVNRGSWLMARTAYAAIVDRFLTLRRWSVDPTWNGSPAIAGSVFYVGATQVIWHAALFLIPQVFHGAAVPHRLSWTMATAILMYAFVATLYLITWKIASEIIFDDREEPKVFFAWFILGTLSSAVSTLFLALQFHTLGVMLAVALFIANVVIARVLLVLEQYMDARMRMNNGTYVHGKEYEVWRKWQVEAEARDFRRLPRRY